LYEYEALMHSKRHSLQPDCVNWACGPRTQVGVEGADVYLLAPGIDRTRATTMIARVVASEFDNRWVRIAVFPDDAITERALIDLVNSPPGRHVPAPFGAARQAS
jgi:hypothetical protein